MTPLDTTTILSDLLRISADDLGVVALDPATQGALVRRMSDMLTLAGVEFARDDVFARR